MKTFKQFLVINEEADGPIEPKASKKHPSKLEVIKHFSSSWTPRLSRDEAHTEYGERFSDRYKDEEIDKGVMDHHAAIAAHYYRNGKWPSPKHIEKMRKGYVSESLDEAHNEHQAKAEQYISYAKHAGDGLISGCRMDLHKDHVIIHQEVDGDEEPSKYIVRKDKVKPHHWAKLVKIAMRHLS